MQYHPHAGARLAYTIHGERGEPALPLPGIGVRGEGWRPQAEGLADAPRLLLFDNRGIGESTVATPGPLSIEQMADDALAVARAAGWESFHVVGHSMGGVIAQRLALAHPEAVRSLALLCTVARGADAVRMNWRQLVLGLRTHFGPRRWRRRAFLELIFPPDYLRSADTDALAAGLAPLFGRDLAEQPPILLRQAMALRRHDATPELHRLRVPALVVCAEHDPIAPPWAGRALAAAIPGARLVELAGASHGVPIQDPPRINGLLAELFAAAAR